MKFATTRSSPMGVTVTSLKGLPGDTLNYITGYHRFCGRINKFFLFVFVIISLNDICNGLPLSQSTQSNNSSSNGGEWFYSVTFMSILLAVCIVSVLFGCLCCENSAFKNVLTTSNGLPANTSHSSSFANQVTHSEFTMFPPDGGDMVTMQPTRADASDVRFDPLPDIRLKGHSGSSVSHMLRPASFGNVINRGINVKDWFDAPHRNFPRNQLQYLQEVGSGWFGHVVEGDAVGITPSQKQSKVVVKILREDATPSDQMYFLQEVKPFRDLSHPHILALLGQCLESDPFLIILEHCAMKDLKSYLIQQRRNSEVLLCGNLLNMAHHISSALCYMHQHGFVHLDLAIRNCVITEALQVKLGDYGTAIEQYKEDYYCLGEVALPLRWCAPESLNCTDTTIETKEITREANIWTFGVVLWEILEFGKLPYIEVSDDDVLQKAIVEGSVTLEQPKTPCVHKDQMYQVMQMCWERFPHKRPSMQKVSALLKYLNENLNLSGDQRLEFENRWSSFQPNNSRDHNLPDDVVKSRNLNLKFESDFNPNSQETDDALTDLSPVQETSHSSLGGFETGEFIPNIVSPSLQNLRGSIEDITASTSPLPQHSTDLSDIQNYDLVNAVEVTDDRMERVPPEGASFTQDTAQNELDSLDSWKNESRAIPEQGSQKVTDFLKLTVIDSDYSDLESPHHQNVRDDTNCSSEITNESGDLKHDISVEKHINDNNLHGDGDQANNTNLSSHNPFYTVVNNKNNTSAHVTISADSNDNETGEFKPSRFLMKGSPSEADSSNASSCLADNYRSSATSPFADSSLVDSTSNSSKNKENNTFNYDFVKSDEPVHKTYLPSFTSTPQKNKHLPYVNNLNLSEVQDINQEEKSNPFLTKDQLYFTAPTSEQDTVFITANETSPLQGTSENVVRDDSKHEFALIFDRNAEIEIIGRAQEEKFIFDNESSTSHLASIQSIDLTDVAESNERESEVCEQIDVKKNESKRVELSNFQEIDDLISESFVFLEKSDLESEKNNSDTLDDVTDNQMKVAPPRQMEPDESSKNLLGKMRTNSDSLEQDFSMCSMSDEEVRESKNDDHSVSSESFQNVNLGSVSKNCSALDKSEDFEIYLDSHSEGSLIPREIPKTVSYPAPEEIVAEKEWVCGNEPSSSENKPKKLNETYSFPDPEEFATKLDWLCDNEPQPSGKSNEFEINLDGHRKGFLIPREIPETHMYPAPEEIVAEEEWTCGVEPPSIEIIPEKSNEFEIDLDGHYKDTLIPREIPETYSYPAPEEIVAEEEWTCGDELPSGENKPKKSNETHSFPDPEEFATKLDWLCDNEPQPSGNSNDFEINLDGHRKGSLIPREIPETHLYPAPEEIVAKKEWICGNEPTSNENKPEESNEFVINLDGHLKGSLIPREISETHSYPAPEEIVAEKEWTCDDELPSSENKPEKSNETHSFPDPEEFSTKLDWLCDNEPQPSGKSNEFEINLDGHHKGFLIPREIPETHSYPAPEEIVAEKEWTCGDELPSSENKPEKSNETHSFRDPEEFATKLDWLCDNEPPPSGTSNEFEINLNGIRKGSLISREIPETHSYPAPEEIIAEKEWICGNEVSSSENKPENSVEFELDLDGYLKGSLIPTEIPEKHSYPAPEEIVAEEEWTCGDDLSSSENKPEKSNETHSFPDSEEFANKLDWLCHNEPQPSGKSNEFEVNLDQKGSMIPRKIPETHSIPAPEEIVAKKDWICGNEPAANVNKPEKFNEFEIDLDGHRKGSLIPREIPETISYPAPEEIVAKEDWLCGNELEMGAQISPIVDNSLGKRGNFSSFVKSEELLLQASDEDGCEHVVPSSDVPGKNLLYQEYKFNEDEIHELTDNAFQKQDPRTNPDFKTNFASPNKPKPPSVDQKVEDAHVNSSKLSHEALEFNLNAQNSQVDDGDKNTSNLPELDLLASVQKNLKSINLLQPAHPDILTETNNSECPETFMTNGNVNNNNGNNSTVSENEAPDEDNNNNHSNESEENAMEYNKNPIVNDLESGKVTKVVAYPKHHSLLDNNDVLIVDTRTNEALMVDKDSLQTFEDLIKETAPTTSETLPENSDGIILIETPSKESDVSSNVEICNETDSSVSSEDATDEFVSSWMLETSNSDHHDQSSSASRSSSSCSTDEIDTSRNELTKNGRRTVKTNKTFNHSFSNDNDLCLPGTSQFDNDNSNSSSPSFPLDVTKAPILDAVDIDSDDDHKKYGNDKHIDMYESFTDLSILNNDLPTAQNQNPKFGESSQVDLNSINQSVDTNLLQLDEDDESADISNSEQQHNWNENVTERDLLYTPDFEDDSEDDTSCSSSSSSSGSFRFYPADESSGKLGVFEEPDTVDDQDHQSMLINYHRVPAIMEDIPEEDEEWSEVKVSSWDANATPTRSSLKSPERRNQNQSEEPKSVTFHEQSNLPVYSYPRISESSDVDPSEISDIISQVDYTKFADWDVDAATEVPEDLVEFEDDDRYYPAYNTQSAVKTSPLHGSSAALYQISADLDVYDGSETEVDTYTINALAESKINLSDQKSETEHVNEG